MPEDPTIEFLSIIHAMQASSTKCQEMLETAVNNADEEGITTIPAVALSAVSAILALQSKLVASLTEENSDIMDHVQNLVETVRSKPL